jgi:hypothetical protein
MDYRPDDAQVAKHDRGEDENPEQGFADPLEHEGCTQKT